jgi:hypothetical protein
MKQVIFFTLITTIFFFNNISYCQDGSGTITNPTFEDSLKAKIKNLGFKNIGIETGIISTEGYDPGFGFGVRLPRMLVDPFVELSTDIFFWGASNDSLDISSLGFEESITFIRSHRKPLNVFFGFSLGCYIINEKNQQDKKIADNIRNPVQPFLKIGTIYELSNRRSLYTEIKYALVPNINEFHFNIGLIFYDLRTINSSQNTPAPVRYR